MLGFATRGTLAHGMENKMCKHLEDCGFHIRKGCVVDPDSRQSKMASEKGNIEDNFLFFKSCFPFGRSVYYFWRALGAYSRKEKKFRFLKVLKILIIKTWVLIWIG
jgi:hypothetical protein